jgi:murein endopeptidase
MASTAALHWVDHKVIPGERMVEIAKRYGVSVDKVLEWNELDPKRVFLRAGQKLKIWTTLDPPQRKYRAYKVKQGDTWASLARRFDVDQDRLRHAWNADHEELLRAGDRLDMWLDADLTRDADVKADKAVAKGEKPAKADDFDFDFGADPTLVPYEEDDPSEDDGEGEDANDLFARKPTAAKNAAFVAVVSRDGRPTDPAERRGTRQFPIINVAKTAFSVGRPSHGRLPHGLQLPENPALYTIRNLDHSWACSHMIEELQHGIAIFRQATGFARQILIEDMSQRGGGRFHPHHSHTSGRDVDIQLPTKKGVRDGIVPNEMSLVDWDATWSLVKAFGATHEVRYIFLSTSRQVPLYRAAQRAGASEQEIEEYLQYPHHAPQALVRHSSGHVKHIHVRFKCASFEAQCTD